jgi:hypothetical protein
VVGFNEQHHAAGACGDRVMVARSMTVLARCASPGTPPGVPSKLSCLSVCDVQADSDKHMEDFVGDKRSEVR